MGMFWYGSSQHVLIIDDRLLMHLQIVMFERFRQQKGFAFSFTDDTNERHVVWMSPNVSVRIEFIEPAETTINPEWIRVLTDAAVSDEGLTAVPEPATTATPTAPSVREFVEVDT